MKKALLLFVAFSIALCLEAETHYPCVGYAKGRCNVRYGPSTDYNIVYEIYDNEEVRIEACQDKFYYIYSPNKGWGWTHVSNLRLGQSTGSNANSGSYPCLGYAKGRCNVRSGASTKSDIVFEIFDNEEVQVQSRTGDFYRIHSPNRGWGWTHVSNLRLGQSTSSKRQSSQQSNSSGGRKSIVVGHTYTKHNAKITNPELAEAYDNGMFRLVVDIAVHFVSSNEMELILAIDIDSDFYSPEELALALPFMLNENKSVTKAEYYVKNGYIYIPSQKEPVAVINSGGKSITFKKWDPFDGNTLYLDD